MEEDGDNEPITLVVIREATNIFVGPAPDPIIDVWVTTESGTNLALRFSQECARALLAKLNDALDASEQRSHPN